MKLVWDLHELTDFGDNLKSLGSAFSPHLKQITREIAEALREALFKNTPVLTGNLSANWGGEENYSFQVKAHDYGYSVTLYNRAANDNKFQYGLAVNDGHWSKNQYGGPYTWVIGKFFVEKSIIQVANSTQIEEIIMKELQKWWDSI
jgi:hypothetical protein